MHSPSSSSPEIYATESESHTHFSYKDATQEEVLEDLSSRFILNLPDEELNSLERLCFQVEQAHWFYEDFIREENTKLPSMPLKKFSEMLFHACPLLQQWSHDHEEAFKNFMQYKTRVPVCGAIMLNDDMDKCVLVKGWKSSSNWGFPKGKINETEPPASCAVREVLEETGYNLANQIEPENVIELTIKEQKISLFIVTGVPEGFNFQTKTRKEISQISWFKLSDLPTWKKSKSQLPNRKFYLISPFIGPLKAFISDRRRRNEKGNGKLRKGRQGTIEPYIVRTNGDLHSYPDSQVQPFSTAPNNRENELGPELSRLFSGLTTVSQKDCMPDPCNNRTSMASCSDDPSDSSIESPGRTCPQLLSSRQNGSFAINGSVPPFSQIEPQSLTQPTGLSLPPDRPAKLRRASGTVDISPYVSSKSELPVSAKTLQHLQLLETVADESARMAPILAARAAMVRQGVAPNIQTQPTPSSSKPHDFTHSSNTSLYANHAFSGDQFQLRSRTSQSFSRPIIHNPTGSMTMHQNHLLAVINGARTVPVTPNYPIVQQPQQPFYHSALPSSRPLNPSYFPSTTPLHPSLPLAPPGATPQPIAGSFAHPMPIFNHTSALASNSLHPHGTSVNVSSNASTNPGPNPLLSILNGRPT